MRHYYYLTLSELPKLGSYFKDLSDNPFQFEIQGLIIYFSTILPGTILYLEFIDAKEFYTVSVILASVVAVYIMRNLVLQKWSKDETQPWFVGFFLYYCFLELIMVVLTKAESFPVLMVYFVVFTNFFFFINSLYHIRIYSICNLIGVFVCSFFFEELTENVYMFVFFVICVCSIGYIITLRRVANINILRQTQEMYEMLATNSVDIISVHDIPTNEIIYISPSILQQTGFSSEEVIKKPYLYAIHPEDIGPYQEIFSYDNFINNESLKFRYRVKARDGFYFWLESNSRGVVENGRLTKIIAISRNINAQVASENALQEYAHELERINQQLKSSNKELEEFAYIASHDLKEPLRTVASYVQLIERRFGHLIDDEGREYIGFATSGVKRMQELISDLLLYSKVGATKIKQEDVDITELLKEICERLSHKITQTEAVLSIDSMPIVHGDSFQLGQLFQNLIANALTFTHPDRKPRIKVTVEEDAHEWRFCVKDNGEGIDKEYHQKIFEMFRRLHTSDGKEGSGMGLSICSRVVANHGGQLWLESSLGEGASFYFSLPKKK